MPRKPPAPSEPADYRRWKFRAAALLERQGLPLGVARERDLRKMYTGGATPEQAAELNGWRANDAPVSQGQSHSVRPLGHFHSKRRAGRCVASGRANKTVSRMDGHPKAAWNALAKRLDVVI
jgi:hypothetical protein